MRDFLIFCSGADKNILEQCPTPEMAKYEGIGGTVFFTGLFAMLSGGYALYFVFHSGEYAFLPAILLGMIWGLFIFNLDRYIVSSMVKQGNFWSYFNLAIPRLALAILLAIVISTPLELKLFETEINAELILKGQILIISQEEIIRKKYKAQEDAITRRFQPAINAITVKIDNLTKESNELESKLSKEKDRLHKLRQDVTYEMEGKSNTKKKGCGSVCKYKQSLVEKAEKEVNRLEQKIKALEQAIASLRKNKEESEKSFNSKIKKLHSSEENEINDLKQKWKNMGKYDGLAARLEALGELTTKNDTLWFAYLFITLLFFTIETAPIFVKLISSKGPYDFILEAKNQRAIDGPGSDPVPDPPFIVHEKQKDNPIWRQRYEDTIRANRERKQAGGN
ncbi:MAG: DUF4407 domain-containing protein [Candidatus Parabeggiatoa sp. nov. 2]|nr:MAG: hypothetical protein B6247_29180 [Beggiatoa sp. 4572_84]RKZ56255.1 MAG: DUF4407 domain-containing protein [Gammaproteobacteria bacterium]